MPRLLNYTTTVAAEKTLGEIGRLPAPNGETLYHELVENRLQLPARSGE